MGIVSLSSFSFSFSPFPFSFMLISPRQLSLYHHSSHSTFSSRHPYRFLSRQGFTQDAVRTAAQREEAFMQAALAEEKMYLLWLNRQRKILGKPEVNDISVSLQDGTIIMEVLAVRWRSEMNDGIMIVVVEK